MTLRPALLPALFTLAFSSATVTAAPVLDPAVQESAEALVGANEHASLVPGTLPPLQAVAKEAPKEVAMSAAQLAQYEGRYALAPQFILSVRQGPDGLLAGATGQPEVPVYASGKDRFFYKVVDAQLEFKRDDQGVITSLVLYQNGQALPAKRLP